MSLPYAALATSSLFICVSRETSSRVAVRYFSITHPHLMLR
jgi:hypothetical protein